MVSGQVVNLCNGNTTVSSIWAADDSKSPGDIFQQLQKDHKRDRTCNATKYRQPASQDAQEAARKCGNWGPTSPSALFLQAFADSLNCLEADPSAGVVSPPLMGSHGTMPLTVIAPLADIVRHCSNLIARAEKEVFFITCAWSPSIAQRFIRSALLELSQRSVARGRRVVVNLMYDTVGPSSLTGTHHAVKPDTYAGKGVQLPGPDEIPGVQLTVASLHCLPLGTLHAKFCVVDRKIAAIMSNNMQDNDNLEMMTRVEGPIVDSILDTALITWSGKLKSAPGFGSSLSSPASGIGTANSHVDLTTSNKIADRATNVDGATQAQLPEHTPEDPHFDSTLEEEMLRIQHSYSRKAKESCLQAINRQLNVPVKKPIEATGPEVDDGHEMTPYITTSTDHSVPMAMVSRPPYAWFGSKNEYVPQNEAWLSLVRNAKRDIFIQTPDLNAAPLLEELLAALKRGVQVTYYVCFGYNDLGEMIPGQGGTNDQVSTSLFSSLGHDAPERALLHVHNYVGKDQNRPIHHSFKARSCHIKLLIADGCVGVQGSGNQDTQSWFHSQEVNVMVDSEQICAKWREGIERNQNTGQFGRVANDGLWRDSTGNVAPGYMGNPGKVEGLVKGIVGMAMKMEGLGGF